MQNALVLATHVKKDALNNHFGTSMNSYQFKYRSEMANDWHNGKGSDFVNPEALYNVKPL